MILTALNQYYQRLAARPDAITGLPRVPPYGFSEEKIGWVLVLSKEGKLVDVVPNYTDDKKPQPKLISVPQSVKRPGVTPKAFFLWDKSSYVLGVEANKDKQSAKEIPWLTSEKTFLAFKTLHLEKLRDIDDVGLQALVKFLQNWQPEQFNQAPCKPEMVDANLAFRLDGEMAYLHQREVAQKLWAGMIEPDKNATLAQCLVTSETAAIARLHPAIKGVYGGQSSGGSIVSFNAESYTSYGKEQGENAPVSEAAAFGYTTALNYLLRRENNQCVSIGDTSTVFWAVADDPDQAEQAEKTFNWMVNMPADDGEETAKLKPVLDAISQGKPLSEINPELDPTTRFYVLGLAPNASRLSIRYWLDTNFGELAAHVAKHWQDLQLQPPAWSAKPPSVWNLLIQTTPRRKNKEDKFEKSKSEYIPKQLAGELMRSILTGQVYPKSLLAKLVGRIRSDGDIGRLRVALIKAILQRNGRIFGNTKEIPMALNRNEPDIAYRLGRLFAVLEKAQSAAIPNLNATIRDRYYGGASSTPNSIFPMLMKNYKNHHADLRKGKKAEWVTDAPKTAWWLEEEIGQITSNFNSSNPFPRTMNLEQQGRFVIGYYHQRFTKHKDAPEEVIVGAGIDTADNPDNQPAGE
ncbi:MAG: type I-C CRISPR-associated protein Cas8c/Csd1 [Nitrosomonadales bacterium]|nr:type I-C CRISPR-associated protein Cas8c/Csd1 [Nitrosomonadales bacterium]